jgi:SAM-dependent methyltransferase
MGTLPEPYILDSLDDQVYRATAALAGLQLDVFTPLKDGPLSAAEIAAALGLEKDRLRPLLYALVIVGLLSVEEGRFENTAEADLFLVRGRPSYQGHRHKFWSDIWSAALVTAESIREGTPLAKHDYATMREVELEDFMHGLYGWTFDFGTWLAQNYDLTSCKSIMDAAGGSGALAIALTEALPRLQATVIELPAVVPVARRFVERAGATERVTVVAADIIRQRLIGSFDAAFLKAFIQTISLEEARLALRNIREALRPGASIFILDSPLDDSRLTPQDLVLFGPVFPAIYDQGQKRTVQEYKDLLSDTGFDEFVLDADRIITALKPEA